MAAKFATVRVSLHVRDTLSPSDIPVWSHRTDSRYAAMQTAMALAEYRHKDKGLKGIPNLMKLKRTHLEKVCQMTLQFKEI
jgi:hypothetical protein